MVPKNAKERKFGGKMERKKKLKEKNINFFTCLVIHEKFKRKKKSFSFVWLTMKKS